MSNNRYTTNRSFPSDQSRATDDEPLAIELEWAPGFVERLLRELPPIRDMRMRALALGERLQSLNADDIVAIAKRLHRAFNAGSEPAHEVLVCFNDVKALEARLGAERLRSLAVLAHAAGEELTAFMMGPHEESPAAGHRTHKDLRELTLGERKALAKSPRKDMLEKLLQDDHPHVQGNLLSNPRITARDVISVAAKRPGAAHVLRGIARHPRWMHNYEVRRALVKNPDTPIDVTGRLILSLQRPDLEELGQDARLSATVRRLAQQRLDAMGQPVYVIDDE